MRIFIAGVVLGAAIFTQARQRASLRFEAINPGFPTTAMGATGSAWVDIDHDGLVDVAIATRDSLRSRVFRNTGGRVTEVPVPADIASTNAVAWGDIDGDGDHDLVLAQSSPVVFETRSDGGQITLVRASDAGVLTSGPPRGAFEALAFSDVDNDGDSDLNAGAHGPAGSFLFLNDGRGRFTIAKRDLFPFASYMGGAHATDLDGDRRIDLLFTGAPFPAFSIGTFLYWNTRADWVADRATAFSEQPGALGSSIGDVDGDGDLDVFLAGWQDSTPSVLYVNEGARRFRKSKTLSPRVVGSSLADIDNDGDFDLVTSSGYTDLGAIELWLNDGRGAFTRSEVPGLTDVPGRYTGLNVVDFDRDGLLDVFVASRRDPVRLFRNVSGVANGQWIDVELRSTRGGVSIWGTRVALELATTNGPRQVLATIHQQSGYGGHGEPVAHYGIPAGARVRRVQVFWSDGQRTTLEAPAPGQRHRVDAPRFKN